VGHFKPISFEAVTLGSWDRLGESMKKKRDQKEDLCKITVIVAKEK
jgi:hypothetical protein